MNKDPGNNGKRPELTNRKTLLVYAALIVLLVFAIVMNREFFVKMTHELREMSIAGIITVCVCGILYRVIDGVVLCQMGHKYSAEFTLPKAVITALCGSFFRVSTLGSGMAVSKIYYMKRDGIEIGNGMGICFLQTIFFKLSILVMGVVAIVCSTVSRAAFANSKIFVIIDIAANVLLVAAMVTIAVNKRLTEFLFRLGKTYDSLVMVLACDTTKKGKPMTSGHLYALNAENLDVLWGKPLDLSLCTVHSITKQGVLLSATLKSNGKSLLTLADSKTGQSL